MQSIADRHTEVDERELVRRVQRALDGDSAAMAELYERFRVAVHNCALRVVRDEDDAQDVTQQVFLKLMTSLRTFSPARGSFQGWLLQVSRHAAVDLVRRRRALPSPDVFAPQVPAAGGSSALRTALLEALSDVPVRQRQVLFLLHVGFRPQEVADQMGISPGAVHVLHHRARRRLVDRLEEEGIRPSAERVSGAEGGAYPLRGAGATRRRARAGATAGAGHRAHRGARDGARQLAG